MTKKEEPQLNDILKKLIRIETRLMKLAEALHINVKEQKDAVARLERG